MKQKKFALNKRLVIIMSTIVVALGFLFISQSYMSYLETQNMVDECYSKGGYPKIEKSGLSIDYFACDAG